MILPPYAVIVRLLLEQCAAREDVRGGIQRTQKMIQNGEGILRMKQD